MTDNFPNVIAATFGAALLWSTMGRKGLQPYIPLADLWRMLGLPATICYILEFIIFVALGVYVGLLLAQPSTPQQAFAAGSAWTAFATRARRQK